MKNKYLAFLKNTGIATGVMIAAGAGVSELAGLFTNNGKIIGASSTISQYIAGFGAFLPLQAWDNRDVYCDGEGRFNYRQFIWDNVKFTASFIPLDILYVVGRPFLQDIFIDNGMSPSKSSITSDTIFIPAYTLMGVGLARLTGVIKSTKRKNLEGMIEK